MAEPQHIFVELSKPYQDMPRTLIYVSHLSHLMVPLAHIELVNAYSIYPQGGTSRTCFIAMIRVIWWVPFPLITTIGKHELIQVLSDSHFVPIDFDVMLWELRKPGI
jgi:hypothetical protein